MTNYWFVKKDIFLTTVYFMGVCPTGDERYLLSKAVYYIELAENFGGVPHVITVGMDKNFNDLPYKFSTEVSDGIIKAFFELTFSSSQVRDAFIRSITLSS